VAAEVEGDEEDEAVEGAGRRERLQLARITDETKMKCLVRIARRVAKPGARLKIELTSFD
jgi:hypothetical protein